VAPGAGEPTEEELERAAAALFPFVEAYRLSVNPEDLDEMAYAVLKHARGAGGVTQAALEEIDRAVRVQLAEEREAHLRMVEAMQRSIDERDES
jgi:hypothetical protein